ncbi:hypothetical protein [uncultured Shimia sp.]|uniref:hypothetical protein n=1 Tax=uncultured Shimia sp. TaxID=573152 RepID=UPI0025CB9630|nr:hypothetical protein [uncultured Shimia sp.]
MFFTIIIKQFDNFDASKTLAKHSRAVHSTRTVGKSTSVGTAVLHVLTGGLMRAALFALTFLATPAFAQCPTAADMETGVRLTDLEGITETYTRDGDHFIRGEWDDGEHFGSRFLLLKGLYVVEQFDTEDGNVMTGSRSTHAYPLKPADAPIPVADGRWDTEVITLDFEGTHTTRETHIFGPSTQVTLGGCSYEMMPIIGIYHDDDGYEETMYYLPELGFSYLVETRPKNEAAERYTYIRIEAVEK